MKVELDKFDGLFGKIQIIHEKDSDNLVVVAKQCCTIAKGNRRYVLPGKEPLFVWRHKSKVDRAFEAYVETARGHRHLPPIEKPCYITSIELYVYYQELLRKYPEHRVPKACGYLREDVSNSLYLIPNMKCPIGNCPLPNVTFTSAKAAFCHFLVLHQERDF